MKNIKYDFANQNYVVTGASSGMGKQVVLELAEAGASVLAIARREKELGCLKQAFPKNIEVAAIDVCNLEKLNGAISSFVELKGKLSGAVHAAGIAGLTPIKSYDMDLAQRIMDVSFWAGINLIQLASKTKYAEKGSSFVLFSSAGAVRRKKGMFSYVAAKAAVSAAIGSIAKEIGAKEHRINAVVPGWVNTDMVSNVSELTHSEEIISNTVLGAGNPEDVSGLILFLLSDRARWITGANILVDGGYTI